MASFGGSGFNANDVDPNFGFEPIPAGKYRVVLADSERKENSKKTGTYLAMVFEVLDGPHTGRKLYTNINDQHPNEQTVKIALGELSAICHAIGIMQPRDSTELHNIPLWVEVGHEKRKDTGELRNIIKKYHKKQQQDASQAPQQTVGNDSAPWLKK